MKNYVTLRPHSITNPSALHRVVEFTTWQAYLDGKVRMYPVHSEHSSAAAAEAEKKRLNTKEGTA